MGIINYKMRLHLKTYSASKETIRFHLVSVLFPCVVCILLFGSYTFIIAQEVKDTSGKQIEEKGFIKEESSIDKSGNQTENSVEKQKDNQSVEKTESKTVVENLKKENIRTGTESIPKKTTIIKTPGNNAGIQEKIEVKKPAWETDEAFFCTLYGTITIDFPIDYFSKLYSSSVGAEVAVIGERWSKWGIHPALRYRMFRLQAIGKPNQVASVFEGHGLGVGVEYRYGIDLPAIKRKLYVHAGFFNGVMLMALFSDNYSVPFYDAAYMLGVSAGVSIRVWEYLVAMISFEYMPVFATGPIPQFLAVTLSMGVRI